MINEYRLVCFCETAGIGPHWPREECPDTNVQTAEERDVVSAPIHYRSSPAKCKSCGHPIECIDVTKHMSFTVGNATKYLWRLDHKGDPIEQLRKARQYIDFEIERREQQAAGSERDGAAS